MSQYNLPAKLLPKVTAIKMVIFDVDGVFTDGKIIYDNSGNELKNFHTLDGMGIKLLMQGSIDVAIITGRQSHITEKRMSELGIKHIYQGQHDKRKAFQDLLTTCHLQIDDIAYVGDDLPDLPLIKAAGFGIAVNNATDFVKQHAAWVTQESGGFGAVREVCEMILAAQDKLTGLQARYLE